MYTKQPKKTLIINILDILRRYTDPEHRLSQKEITEILEREYNTTADRKSIRRNLTTLLEMDYDIDYTETVRINKKGEPEIICGDWYIQREFSDAELRLLIDGVLFSKHIPHHQRCELIEKLSKQSNVYFDAKVRHIRGITENQPENKELFLTIEVIDEAISKGRKVAFTYNSYDVDKKLHPRREGKYIINPYQIAACNGIFYLICSYDGYGTVSNYRLDRIKDIEMLDEAVSPAPTEWSLPKHTAEHIYMFAGESRPVTFRAKRYLVSDIIDWFGTDVAFYDITDDEVTARVVVNLQAMRHWALQYGRHVRVLSPDSLVEEIKKDIETVAENYRN